MRSYRAPWWLPGGNLQTIWPALWSRRPSHGDAFRVMVGWGSATCAIPLGGDIDTLRPDVRRVMMTGHPDLSGIIQGLHSGAIDRLVHKPFTRDELLSAVRLDAPQAHPLPVPAPAGTAARRASA